ncbi:MAG: hypothetical protein HPM95_16410 [Alphaproteobacteria bacterium]|nr:hypothetical protein [Alphaproteobacteria bacterium]
MHQLDFLDPLGSQLPALEKNILKLRAFQMVLALFYAEELKRQVVSLIQDTERLMNGLKPGSVQERVPKGTKKPVEKALNALLQDGAITDKEKSEIKALVDYRNTIGHRPYELFADLSDNPIMRKICNLGSSRIENFDYGAVERLQYFRRKLNQLYKKHHYPIRLSSNDLMFKGAERAFLAEIESLKRTIRRLLDKRNEDIEAINAQFSLSGTVFEKEEFDPKHPRNKYDNGRLTTRGEEICYRLFDSGRTPIAIAHLMKISLRAARHRYKLWVSAGAKAVR